MENKEYEYCHIEKHENNLYYLMRNGRSISYSKFRTLARAEKAMAETNDEFREGLRLQREDPEKWIQICLGYNANNARFGWMS